MTGVLWEQYNSLAIGLTHIGSGRARPVATGFSLLTTFIDTFAKPGCGCFKGKDLFAAFILLFIPMSRDANYQIHTQGNALVQLGAILKPLFIIEAVIPISGFS